VVRRLAFAVPGDLATPTGGYAYDRRMIAELRRLGWQVDVFDLGFGFPRANAAAKAAAHARLGNAPKGCPIVIDGLAFGVLPEAAAELRQSNPLVALVHHPLAQESGLSSTEAQAFLMSERAALATAQRVIVTSPSTANLLAAEYATAADCITVAPPGTARATPAPGSNDGVIRLLSVGAVVPRKGFDVLIAALATLVDLPWRLAIAGDRTRDLAASARLDADIARFGLQQRIDVLGAVPDGRIASLYAGADLFVLASRHEGYGMAFAEAMAHGLPVIGTTAGAIRDTVPPEAGVLVAPDDAMALARALRMLIENAAQRHKLATAAYAASQTLPTWSDSAMRFSNAIEALA
jgi:glycosyltransferase involved in cell wall biosynthesis